MDEVTNLLLMQIWKETPLQEKWDGLLKFACSSLNERHALKTLDQKQQAMPACFSCHDFGKESVPGVPFCTASAERCASHPPTSCALRAVELERSRKKLSPRKQKILTKGSQGNTSREQRKQTTWHKMTTYGFQGDRVFGFDLKIITGLKYIYSPCWPTWVSRQLMATLVPSTWMCIPEVDQIAGGLRYEEQSCTERTEIPEISGCMTQMVADAPGKYLPYLPSHTSIQSRSCFIRIPALPATIFWTALGMLPVRWWQQL